MTAPHCAVLALSYLFHSWLVRPEVFGVSGREGSRQSVEQQCDYRAAELEARWGKSTWQFRWSRKAICNKLCSFLPFL